MARRPPRKQTSQPPAKRQDQPAQTHQRQTNAARVTETELQLYQSMHVGPLPSPEDLERYADVHPRAVEIILSAFEDQTKHRRDMERTVVAGSETRAGIGQWMAFLLVALGIVAGSVVATIGEPVAGASIAGAAIGSAALSYIIGGRPPKPEG